MSIGPKGHPNSSRGRENKMQRILISLAVLAMATAAPVWAQTGASSEHLGIELSGETFIWEFTRNNATVQEETGARVRLGMTWDNYRRRTFGWVYSGEANFMVGSSDHEDFTTAPTTERKVNYAGIQAEGTTGIHFGTSFGVNLLAGLGFDGMGRFLQGPTAGPATPLADANEYWLILYTKFGLGLSHDFTYGHWRLEGGAKMPIYTKTLVEVDGFDNTSFEPKKRGSLYAQLKLNFGKVDSVHAALTVYYDGYVFGDGGTETLTVDSVPTASTYTLDKSESRVLGARLTYFFH